MSARYSNTEMLNRLWIAQILLLQYLWLLLIGMSAFSEWENPCLFIQGFVFVTYASVISNWFRLITVSYFHLYQRNWLLCMEFKRPQQRKYQEESFKAFQALLKHLSDSDNLDLEQSWMYLEVLLCKLHGMQYSHYWIFRAGMKACLKRFSRYKIYWHILSGPDKRETFSSMSFLLISGHRWRW